MYVALTSTYEGRDKVVKLFQYFTKFCSWYYLRKDAKISVNYFLVSGKDGYFVSLAKHDLGVCVERVREARQLFRIFKSLFEFKRI